MNAQGETSDIQCEICLDAQEGEGNDIVKRDTSKALYGSIAPPRFNQGAAIASPQPVNGARRRNRSIMLISSSGSELDPERLQAPPSFSKVVFPPVARRAGAAFHLFDLIGVLPE